MYKILQTTHALRFPIPFLTSHILLGIFWLPLPLCFLCFWLVVSQPPWTKSVHQWEGWSHIYPYTIHYYIYPIYEMENKIHVPNHQPGLVVQPHGYCYNPTPLRRCGDFSTKPWRLRHECRITARVGCHALLPPWIRGICHHSRWGIRGMTTSHHQPIRPTLW